MIRKAALMVGAPALLAFMALNAYLAINHLRQVQKLAAFTLQSSMIQAYISAVLEDFVDLESGQRGYLLTEDSSYLGPYNDAKSRIQADFARLRMGLADRAGRERSLESQLESLAGSKQAELMEHAVNLRQQGYRHRAFLLVNSDQSMGYIDQARGILSSISSAESSSSARFDKQRDATLSRALRGTILANSCLILLTVGLLALVRYHGRMLERETAESRSRLAERDLQLEKLTSALSTQVRTKTAGIEANARLLLQHYGGFLPRQGNEYAERIKEAAAQMERLCQELLNSPREDDGARAA